MSNQDQTAADRRSFISAAAGLGAAVGTLGATPAQAQGRPAGAQPAQAPAADPRPVITRRTGRVEGEITALGLGTFVTFDLLPGADREPLRQVTRTYLEAGVRVVDTSPLYGNGEPNTGAFLASLPAVDRLFISNKVWATGEFLADESHALRGLEQSQIRLWRQQMDAMFCHNLVNIDVIVPMLNAWKRENRIRMTGVSHHENDYHDIITRWIERGQLDAVQINYSIFNRNIENRLLPAAADRGVAVFANLVLEKARLTHIARGQRLPDFAREIGAETWSQFFIKWVMAEPRITCALTATSNPAHAAENVAALRGPLPDAAMRRRMVAHMETIPGFSTLAAMPWYPEKQGQYQGLIRREQARMRQRLA
jgi:diketogulonate reductase-like aldo/keto reductase